MPLQHHLPMRLPIGTSSAFFRPFEPEKHIPLVAKEGFEFIELAGNIAPLLEKPEWFREVGRIALDNGIKINSIHVPFFEGEDLSSLDRAIHEMTVKRSLACIQKAEELGARCVVQHPSTEPISNEERANRFAAAQQGLLRIVDAIPASFKVKVAVESLPRTCITNSVFEHLKLLEPFDSERVGICLDTNHVNLGQDLLWATREYGKRIFTLHISDNDGAHERHWLPGEGVIRWRNWLDILLSAGYSGPLMHEYTPWSGGKLFDPEVEMHRLSVRARELFG